MILDLSELTKEFGGQTALLTLALGVVKFWIRKFNRSHEDLSEGISGLHDKLNRMEIKLAGAGIDDLKTNTEKLNEARVKHDMQIQALFRAVDLPKRASDGGNGAV